MRTPARSTIFCTRLRTVERCLTGTRRWRAQRAQLPERLERHMGRCAEPELAHAGQPHAVGHVGLAPLQLLHLTRMHQDRLDPGRLQGREGRLPVDPVPSITAASTP